jgi:hypothetical protein
MKGLRMSKSTQIYKKLENYMTNNNFTFDLNEQPTVQEFEEVIGEEAILVAQCEMNTPVNFPSSSSRLREYFDLEDEDYDGKKIDYKGLSPLWNDNNSEWLYFLAYNNHIVKIGMTITSLKERYGSYSCGTSRAMKKGSCSTTNFIISECNTLAVSKGISVQIYGLPVEKEKKIEERFGVKKECVYSTVRDKETMLLEAFKENYQQKPALCVQEGK